MWRAPECSRMLRKGKKRGEVCVEGPTLCTGCSVLPLPLRVPWAVQPRRAASRGGDTELPLVP